jgi:hypothetical protein
MLPPCSAPSRECGHIASEGLFKTAHLFQKGPPWIFKRQMVSKGANTQIHGMICGWPKRRNQNRNFNYQTLRRHLRIRREGFSDNLILLRRRYIGDGP